MTEDYPYGYSGYEQEKLSKGFTGKGAADLKESFALGEPLYARAHARACAYAHTLAIFTTPTSLGPHWTSLLLSFAWPAFSCNLCVKCDALGLQGRRTQRRGCLLGASRSRAPSGSSKLGKSTEPLAVADALAVLSARAQPCALKAVACSYYSAMETLSSQLLQLFALALGLEPQCVPHTAGGSGCSAHIRTNRMHTPAARTPAATAAARVRHARKDVVRTYAMCPDWDACSILGEHIGMRTAAGSRTK